MRYLISFLIAVLFGFFSPARADESRTLLNCEVSSVIDDSVFDESLSVDEYPNISVKLTAPNAYELQIGASVYRSTEGSQISPLNYGHNVVGVELLNSIDGRIRPLYKLTVMASEPQNGEGFMPGLLVLNPSNPLLSIPSRIVAEMKCDL